MSADRVTYVDSSALVKLVVREPESTALRRYLRRRHPLVSSALARTEVSRAVLPLGKGALRQARKVLARVELVRVSNRVLNIAGTLELPELRTLHAIHLATASLFGDTVARLVCYDDRMTRGAQALGLTVDRPT